MKVCYHLGCIASWVDYILDPLLVQFVVTGVSYQKEVKCPLGSNFPPRDPSVSLEVGPWDEVSAGDST